MTAFHTQCDRSHIDECRDCAAPGWILAASIVASGLAFLDGSIVNVALPALGKSLGGGAADLQWVINGYLLTLSALLLLGGAAGDNFGRRKILLAGIAVFALASIGCAVAPNFMVLVPMRALQGVGAAMLMPNSLALLAAAFSGEARGRAIGTWAAAGVGFSAVGPPLGGWLVAIAGWPMIFLINVPIAVIAIVITLRFVPEMSDGNGTLDWVGALLASVALALITWAVTLASSRGPTVIDALILAGGLVVCALFVRYEKSRGENAMMPVAMFASRAFVGLTVVTFLIYGALGGLFVLFPYVLIEGGYSPLQAGLALLPFSLIVGLVSRPLGQLAGRIGSRWPLVLGSLVSMLGYLSLMLVEPSGSYWTTVVPGAALVALGSAGAVAPLTTAVLAAVDRQHTGTANGFNSAVARTGALIATAFSGAVLVQKGAMLVSSFHAAAFVGAALAFVSAVAAFFSLGPPAAEDALAAPSEDAIQGAR